MNMTFQKKFYNSNALLVKGLLLVSVLLLSSGAAEQELTPEHKAVNLFRKETAEIVEQLTTQYPDDLKLIRIGISFHKTNRHSLKALELLNKAISIKPKEPYYTSIAGKILFETGDYENAVMYWKKALVNSKQKTQLLNDIGEALIFSGKNTEAIKGLKKNLSILSGSRVSLCLLGRAYLQLADYKKAEFYYQKAIDLDAAYYEANYGLGKVYMRLKQPDKAKPYMEKYKRGYAKFLEKTYNEKKEINILKIKLIEFSKQYSRTCLAAIQLSGNDRNKVENIFNDFEKTYLEAISLVPDRAYLHSQLAHFYVKSRRKLDKAQQLAEKAVDIKKTDQNYYILAKCYYANSKKAKAEDAIKIAIKLNPKNNLYKKFQNAIRRMR